MIRLLNRSDVERLLDIPACIAAVEHAFRQRALGRATPSGVLGLHVEGGGFHVKAAATAPTRHGRRHYAAKINANFPANPRQHGLPTIQGVLALFDAVTGTPLAVIDSMSVTTLRTAAATAVAARRLALPSAGPLTIIGCGVQARAHLAALRSVRPVSEVFAYDLDPATAERFASEMRELHDMRVTAVTAFADGTRRSAMIVTCTPASQAFLGVGDVRAGAFIGAVGADSEHKHEIEPSLMAAARVVVDDLDQCAAIGDLHHALEAGAMRREDVRAQLGDVVIDPGRARDNDRDIVIFDSTGVALEDVAAATVVYERAEREGLGLSVDLGA